MKEFEGLIVQVPDDGDPSVVESLVLEDGRRPVKIVVNPDDVLRVSHLFPIVKDPDNELVQSTVFLPGEIYVIYRVPKQTVAEPAEELVDEAIDEPVQ